MAAAGAEVLVRLLALPVLGAVVFGFGADAESAPHGSVVARAAKATLMAGTARFVISSDYRDSGTINLGNDTAVSDRGWIFSTHECYLPLAKREAVALGIDDKRWLEQPGCRYALVDDPFLTGTRTLFDVIAQAVQVHTLGLGTERGVPVDRYAAKVPLQAFVAAHQSFDTETPPASKPIDDTGPTGWRDFLVNYRGADPDGQSLKMAVDSHGRIRSLTLDLDEPVTVELNDYGVSVDISAPPANTVIAYSAYGRLKSNYCSEPRRQTLPRPYPCQ
jgi:hypothetical protein